MLPGHETSPTPMSAVPHAITLQDVQRARQTIEATILRTALIDAPALSGLVGNAVTLKPECLQRTGSFKIRGAANRIANLSPGERERGIVTASSGNHGRAVAYVAQALGVPAVISMSERVPAGKVAAIEQYGAEVVQRGRSYDDAERTARALAARRGLTWISAFDEPDVIAGQGTLGLEVLDDCPGVRTVLVPLSGGGLISGVALALKAVNPLIRVVGVSMARAPMMYLSLRAGRPMEVPEEETLADALIGNIGARNRHTFRMAQTLVDDVVLVSEGAIADAIRHLHRSHGLVVEGGGAVGVAALLSGQIREVSGDVVVVLSGGNIEPSLFERLTAGS